MNGESASGLLTREHADRWERVQESFARITGLSVWTIDPNGRVLGRPSSPSPLCLLLRHNERARAVCNEDCISSCRRALRSNTTVFFRCHAELHCFAAPLCASGRPIGVLLAGQVLTGPPPLERFRELAATCNIGQDKLLKALGGMTIGSERVLRQAATFISETAEAIFTGWESEDRSARKLNLLNNLLALSSEFSPEMDPYSLYALALNSLAILFDLGNAALFVEEGENGPLAARYAFGDNHGKLMSLRLKREEPLLQDFFRNPAPVAFDDYYPILKAGFPDEVTQVTAFPLFGGQRVNGLLAVFNQPLDGDQQRMIAYFLNTASATIQNVTLQREVKRRVSAMASFSGFNEKMRQTLELDRLLEIIFEEAAALAHAEKASLMLLDEKTRELMVRLVRGSDGEMLKKLSVPLGEGPAGKAATEGEPILVKDLEQDRRFHDRNRPRYRTPSFVVLPLKAGDRTIGVLNVADKEGGEAYDERDLEALCTLTGQASVALERSQLFELSRELKRISITDHLTGLLNRRYFQERSTEELQRSQRYGQPFSIIMIDVDSFKEYNDRFGHPAGDTLLNEVGKVVKASVRVIDVVARYGGEEFAVLLPNSDRDEALRIAERVRAAVDQHLLPLPKGPDGGRTLTISAGVASFPADAADLKELINNADKALYLAKKAGKNRVSALPPAG